MSELNKELLSFREDMERYANKNLMPILQVYKRALEDVRVEIAKIYTRYFVDGKLNISGTQRYTVLKQLEKTLIEQAQKIGLIDVDHTTKILGDVFTESYYKTAFIIDSGVTAAISFAIVNPEMVNAIVNTPVEGAMFSDRIWRNKSLLVDRVKRQVERGMVQGVSIDKLAKSIKKEFDVSAYESKRLVHTELARVQSEASASVYAQSNVVNFVMYDATLDGKTSEICRSLDGKMFDANSNYPKPPMHPNCRSAIVPVIDRWKPTKKRENIKNDNGDKPIIDYSNYDDWKKLKGIT